MTNEARWYTVAIRDPDWARPLDILANVVRLENGQCYLEHVTESGEVVLKFVAPQSSVVYVLAQAQN